MQYLASTVMQPNNRWIEQGLTSHTHTHPFNGPLYGITRVSWYQKSKTNLDFTEARDNEWQSHQLGHMQVCTSLQTDNHASTPPLSFLQAGCPSCCPTNSVKALKARLTPQSTQNRSFRRRSSQPISWLGNEKTKPTKLTTKNQSDLN